MAVVTPAGGSLPDLHRTPPGERAGVPRRVERTPRCSAPGATTTLAGWTICAYCGAAVPESAIEHHLRWRHV